MDGSDYALGSSKRRLPLGREYPFMDCRMAGILADSHDLHN